MAIVNLVGYQTLIRLDVPSERQLAPINATRRVTLRERHWCP